MVALLSRWRSVVGERQPHWKGPLAVVIDHLRRGRGRRWHRDGAGVLGGAAGRGHLSIEGGLNLTGHAEEIGAGDRDGLTSGAARRGSRRRGPADRRRSDRRRRGCRGRRRAGGLVDVEVGLVAPCAAPLLGRFAVPGCGGAALVGAERAAMGAPDGPELLLRDTMQRDRRRPRPGRQPQPRRRPTSGGGSFRRPSVVAGRRSSTGLVGLVGPVGPMGGGASGGGVAPRRGTGAPDRALHRPQGALTRGSRARLCRVVVSHRSSDAYLFPERWLPFPA